MREAENILHNKILAFILLNKAVLYCLIAHRVIVSQKFFHALFFKDNAIATSDLS